MPIWVLVEAQMTDWTVPFGGGGHKSLPVGPGLVLGHRLGLTASLLSLNESMVELRHSGSRAQPSSCTS